MINESTKVPFLFLERGYFHDVKYFFNNKKLSGFKMLFGICDLRCYYCHRIPHIEKHKGFTIGEILNETKKWEPFDTVTLTGGEVTLLTDSAIYIADLLREQGNNIIFSTNGRHPKEVQKFVEHADVAKIDLKTSRRNFKRVCGVDYYNIALNSIEICTSAIPTEVKILIHSFTKEEDIKTRLIDLERVTSFPKNMIIEFQLIHDFLNTGIGIIDSQKYREICKNISPLPDVTLFKEYGSLEKIQILKNDEWKPFSIDEIPLVINNQHKKEKDSRFNW